MDSVEAMAPPEWLAVAGLPFQRPLVTVPSTPGEPMFRRAVGKLRGRSRKREEQPARRTDPAPATSARTATKTSSPATPRAATPKEATPEPPATSVPVATEAAAPETDTPSPAPETTTIPPATPEPAPPVEAALPAGLGSIAAALAGGGLAALAETEDSGVRATSGAGNVGASGTATHTAEDGEDYWGPVDNESARARAQGQTLIIDQEECINCGTCVENTDHVFALPDEGKAVAIRQEGDMGLIQDAIDACPVTCIHWTDEPETFPQVNDAVGNEL